MSDTDAALVRNAVQREYEQYGNFDAEPTLDRILARLEATEVRPVIDDEVREAHELLASHFAGCGDAMPAHDRAFALITAVLFDREGDT